MPSRGNPPSAFTHGQFGDGNGAVTVGDLVHGWFDADWPPVAQAIIFPSLPGGGIKNPDPHEARVRIPT